MTLDALLIDLDGVLVDSMPVIRQIFQGWARSIGLDPEHVVRTVHGRPTAEGLGRLVPPPELAGHLDFLTREEIRRSADMRCLPGARTLLARLPAGSWAVVTSGTRAVAEERLRATGLPRPAVLVSADDVTAGKPAPDCYLLAAKLLGVAPTRCLVLEDAPAGVQAARAAGMRYVGIGDRSGAEPPASVIGSLAELRVDIEEGLLHVTV